MQKQLAWTQTSDELVLLVLNTALVKNKNYTQELGHAGIILFIDGR